MLSMKLNFFSISAVMMTNLLEFKTSPSVENSNDAILLLITGESLKMMLGEHSSWQEAMPNTLQLFLSHGLSLSCH